MKYLFLIFILLASCKQAQIQSQAPVTTIKASWEKYPENKPWTDFAAQLIGEELFQSFDKAQDASQLCPAYNKLTHDQKTGVWVELISGIAFYESGWNPASVFNEPPPLGYPSIGLLQLSYEDHAAYSFCPAKVAKDLKDPLVNLDCGIRILAHQIDKRGSVMLSSNVYWSTLKIGGKYSKIPQIKAMVQKLEYCQ